MAEFYQFMSADRNLTSEKQGLSLIDRRDSSASKTACITTAPFDQPSRRRDVLREKITQKSITPQPSSSSDAGNHGITGKPGSPTLGSAGQKRHAVRIVCRQDED